MIYLDASESFSAYYLLQKREFYKLSTKTSLRFKLRLSEHNLVGLYNLLNVIHSGSLTSIKFAHALVNVSSHMLMRCTKNIGQKLVS